MAYLISNSANKASEFNLHNASLLNTKISDLVPAPKKLNVSQNDFVYLREDSVPSATYRSEIIDVSGSQKFPDALIVKYRLNRKLPDNSYDKTNIDVVFTYFKRNPHYVKFINTLLRYGLSEMTPSNIKGLTEEVTVVYLSNEEFGYFDPRILISMPEIQDTTATTSSNAEDDEALPF